MAYLSSALRSPPPCLCLVSSLSLPLPVSLLISVHLSSSLYLSPVLAFSPDWAGVTWILHKQEQQRIQSLFSVPCDLWEWAGLLCVCVSVHVCEREGNNKYDRFLQFCECALYVHLYFCSCVCPTITALYLGFLYCRFDCSVAKRKLY